MAVVFIKEQSDQRTSSETTVDGVVTITYQSLWHVQNDDANDNFADFKDNAQLPQPDQQHPIDPTATCSGRTSRLIDKTDRLNWYVFVTHTSATPSEAAQGGQEVGVPGGDFKIIRSTPITRRKIRERGEYQGMFNVFDTKLSINPEGWSVGEDRCVTNSAGNPRRIEREEYLQAYEVTKAYSTWNGSLQEQYQGTMNEDAWRLQEADDEGLKLDLAFEPKTCLMGPIGFEKVEFTRKLNQGGGVLVQNIIYFLVTFKFIHNKKTWIHKELDAGREQLVVEGKPDGFDGTFAAADLPVDGLSGTVEIRDKYGALVRDEKMLDGKGVLLTPYLADLAVYSGWRFDELKQFGNLQL